MEKGTDLSPTLIFWQRQLNPSLKTAYLCIYAIIIIALYVYNYHISPTYGDVINNNIPEVDVVKNVKCAIPYSKCEYDRVTGWNIGRFIVFGLIGWINPDSYSTMGLFSIIIALMSGSNKGHPRMITNLATNMLGYTIGSNVRQLAMPRMLLKNHI
jgi:hypothetical protein